MNLCLDHIICVKLHSKTYVFLREMKAKICRPITKEFCKTYFE